MSTQFASLVSIDYRLRFFPHTLSTADQLQEKALMCCTHLQALGNVLARLNSIEAPRERLDLPPQELHFRAVDLEKGLHVLGTIQAAIADEAYTAIVELAEELRSQIPDPGKEASGETN